jgi:hypothetical protein
MSRIQLNIERLVLRGLQPASGNALAAALRAQLRQLLSDPATRADWAVPHHTPVLKLGRIPFASGTAGGKKLGARMASEIRRGLKP